jgi:hypothetical protein
MGKSKLIFLITTIIFAATTILGLVGYLSASSDAEKYKNESDAIVADAVSAAKVAQKEEDTAHFYEEAKKPYAEYVGLSDFGSIKFNYPKNWSVYNSQFAKDGYEVVFYPGVVPMIGDQVAMALRVSVVNKQYEAVIAEYEKFVITGQLRATVINVAQADNFAGYEGIRFDGAINETLVEASFVVLKLRDKTILIRTDSVDYLSDFDEIILPTFRYAQ